LTIDASIRIKDTYIGVNTDGNGEFEIAVQKGTVLEMSCLGYYTKKTKIKKKEPIIIKLKDTGAML